MLWPFCPLSDFTESLSWRTDVIRPYASEQRIRLTDTPRRGFVHDYRMTAERIALATELVRENAPAPFLLPEWQEAQRVSVGAGATVVPCDTTLGQFVAGGTVVLWTQWDTCETAVVASLSSAAVTLAAPLSRAYPSALIAPVCTAYLDGALSITRSRDPVQSVGAGWQVFESVPVGEAGLDTYMGDPLLPLPLRPGGNPLTEQLERATDRVDNGLATPFFDTTLGVARQTLGVAYVGTTLADRWTLRRLLYALRGRSCAFWMPNPAGDLVRVRLDADRVELAYSDRRVTRLRTTAIEVPA